jgi:phage gp29-like protein
VSTLTADFVTRARSIEWADIWGYLPDPDPILLKAGIDVTVFDQLLSDAHVFACYQSRKAGVLTSEWRIEYPKGAEKYSAFLEKNIAGLPFTSIISQFLDAPFYGFAVNEISWELRDGKWVPVKIEQKPNEWFVWDRENRCRFLSKKDMNEGELLPDYKFLIPRNFPTFKNPYGMRILSRCFWPVVFKRAGYKYWTTFMERFGIPWLLGKVPRGTDKPERDELLASLTKMVQSAVAVINDDEAIEPLETKSKGGNDNIFAQMVNSANGEISKAILTQTLTTEIGDKGAYAASQSHLSVRSDLCTMDRKLVCEVFNTLISWCVTLNFADSSVMPYMKWIEEEDAKEEHARRDTQLTSQGVRFKPSYYQRVYNLRADEFEVVDPAEMNAPAKTDQEKEKKKSADRTKTREDPKKSTKDKK